MKQRHLVFRNGKRFGRHFLINSFLLTLILITGGCSTLSVSKKLQQQNIVISTSQLMVEGKTLIHAYTKGFFALTSVEEVAKNAANIAADEGYSDITVLVTPLERGIFGIGVVLVAMSDSIYEISYWRNN